MGKNNQIGQVIPRAHLPLRGSYTDIDPDRIITHEYIFINYRRINEMSSWSGHGQKGLRSGEWKDKLAMRLECSAFLLGVAKGVR